MSLSRIQNSIHVANLSQAHLLELKHLVNGGNSDVFNLGNRNGFYVRAVIETVCKVIGKDIKVIERDHRLGDPPCLVGSGEKATKILGGNPQYSRLGNILSHVGSGISIGLVLPKVQQCSLR